MSFSVAPVVVECKLAITIDGWGRRIAASIWGMFIVLLPVGAEATSIETGEHSRHPVARLVRLFNQSMRCVHLSLYLRNFAAQISGVGTRVLQLPGELQVHTVSVVFLEVGFIH